MKKINLLLLLLISAMINNIYAQISNANNASQKLQKNKYFIKNQGQWADDILYLAQIENLNAWITKSGVVYDFYHIENIDINQPDNTNNLQTIKHGHAVKFANKSSTQSIVIDEKNIKGTYLNYFKGNNPVKWQSNVAIFEEIVIKNIYEGIDQRWYFDNGNLRYDYIVNKGADYKKIKISIEGSDNYYISNNDLIFTTRFGDVKQSGLYVYQNINNQKTQINSSWKNENGLLSFEINNYDPNYQLIIDPLISSTFLGGSGDDVAKNIYVDNDGYIYILGITYSNNFPVTTGVYDQTHNGFQDIFVTKMNNEMNTIVFSTYLGGDSEDEGYSFAFDANKNIYITGLTSSSNFPTTPGGFDAINNSRDAFITKLNSTGTNLEYSTYIGGADWDFGYAIVVDNQGKAYITGKTWSNNFPTTTGAYNISYNGGVYDVYVLKMNATGTALEYSTYIGGDNTDIANAIAIDSDGNVYVAGTTKSGNFPTTAGAFSNTNYGGDRDAFLTKLNSNGSAVVFSTFIGGNNWDEIYSIALDNDKNVYVTGRTYSSDFPTTANVFDNTHNGSYDVFVTKFNNTGANLIFSTYVGGGAEDEAYYIKLDQNSNIFISGMTYSNDIPVSTDAYDNSYNGNYDAYFLKLNSNAQQLLYATYLGGGNSEMAYSLDIDNQGFIYLAGYTNTINFPTTAGAYDQTHNGDKDVFVSKLYICQTDFVSISVTPNDTVCAGTEITLTASGANSYNWSNGITNNVPFVVNATNTFFVIGTDIYGCQDTANIIITVKEAPNVTVSATPDTICQNMQTILQAFGAASYIWDNGLGSANPVTTLPSATTTYNVIGTDSNGCSNSANITVIVHNLPNVTTTATPDTICQNMQTILQAFGAASYIWDNGLGAANPVTTSPNATTTYNVIGTDSNGCSNSANITVVVYNLPNVTATATPDTICQNMQTTLQAFGAASYIWDNGLGAANPVTTSPNTTTTYNVIGTDSNGCSKGASITVVVHNLPNVTATATPNPICQGTNSTLTAFGALLYFWNNGIGFGNPINVFPNTTTIYQVIGVDNNGCADSAEITVIVNPSPDTTIINNGDTLIAQQNNALYQWVTCPNYSAIFGAQAQTFIPTTSGQYAAIINLNGCIDTTNCHTVFVGIPENQSPNNWIIFPNPNNGNFQITSKINASFELIDASGKIVNSFFIKSNTTTTINETLQKGIYLLREQNNGGIIKIIVQ